MSRIASFVCLSALLATAACSGSDEPTGPAGISSDLSAFQGYCTGTLISERELMLPAAGGGWESDGSVKAPAGSQFLLAEDFDKWEGYVIMANGSAAKLNSGFAELLERGEDFVSECEPTVENVDTDRVLLQASSFYPDQELRGERCVVPAGASFDSYSFRGGSDVASFSSPQLEGPCGFTDGYTSDAVFGNLVRKQP